MDPVRWGWGDVLQASGMKVLAPYVAFSANPSVRGQEHLNTGSQVSEV